MSRREEVAASYDRMSGWYDVLAGPFEGTYRAQGLQKLRVEDGEAVLEVGCGTGHSVVALARSVGDSGLVHGIDVSAGMLRIARSRVDAAGLSERVRLERGDAANLPCAAHSFDAVLMSFTLELFDGPEIPIVLYECRRVLKGGGRICVVALSRREQAGAVVRLYEWAHGRFPRYVDCRPILVQQVLQDAGFRVLDVTEVSRWGLPVAIALAGKHQDTLRLRRRI